MMHERFAERAAAEWRARGVQLQWREVLGALPVISCHTWAARSLEDNSLWGSLLMFWAMLLNTFSVQVVVYQGVGCYVGLGCARSWLRENFTHAWPALGFLVDLLILFGALTPLSSLILLA